MRPVVAAAYGLNHVNDDTFYNKHGEKKSVSDCCWDFEFQHTCMILGGENLENLENSD